MKLNIGCGSDIKPNYINLDKRQWGGVDIVRDITRGLPFADSTFEYIYASNCLEHIKQGEDLFFVISEFYRVLELGGILFINVPHSSSPQAFFPDHVSYWNEFMLRALLDDPYQSYGTYKFEVVEMTHIGYELKITLKKI